MRIRRCCGMTRSLAPGIWRRLPGKIFSPRMGVLARGRGGRSGCRRSRAYAEDPCPWVFPSSVGTPLDPFVGPKPFSATLRAAGLPRFRLYDLRHTFATHRLAQGAPITYVAARLGHAKPTTTLTYYAHWIPSGDKRFIERLQAIRSAAKVENGRKVVAAGEGDDAEVRDSEWRRGRELNPRPTD